MMIQKTISQVIMKKFGNPAKKLKPLSFKDSKKECHRVNVTEKEIKEAKKYPKYICMKCGYHENLIRRCPACGSWLRYHQLWERVLDLRKLEKDYFDYSSKK